MSEFSFDSKHSEVNFDRARSTTVHVKSLLGALTFTFLLYYIDLSSPLNCVVYLSLNLSE